MSKLRFASQVDVSNNLSRPVTQHYFPKRRESVSAKPDHMIASSESRVSSKNMPRFSSNDMVHNHYLDEARKKTQERDRNSKTNVIPSARFQSTVDGSKPKPKSTNHSTRSLPVSKSSCVTITAIPKADHSKSSSSFSDSKHFVCSTCPKFSPNKTFAVYEKTPPRSDLRWKPTGRIFKSVGLRWIHTGKLFDSCTSKVDSEPPHGSNVDIPNTHECKQTLAVSAGKSQSMVAEKADISETIVKVDSQMMIHKNDKVHSVLCSTNMSMEKIKLFQKSSDVTTADASDKHQQQPDSTSSTSTLATTVTADGNFDLFKRRCCNHVPAKSDSLPHTHTQAFKVNHSASRLLILNFLKDLQTYCLLIWLIGVIWVKFWDNKEKKDTKLDDDTTRQANTTGDGCQFAPASTGCLTTSTTADLQRQFTPPLDEASSFHNQSISTTPLSYAYVERHQAPIACDQIVGVSSNVRRRLTTSQSIMLVNVSRLPRTSKQHLWPSDILRNHDTPSDYATQAYMVQDVVTQQLSTPRIDGTDSDRARGARGIMALKEEVMVFRRFASLGGGCDWHRCCDEWQSVGCKCCNRELFVKFTSFVQQIE
ncbi:hypothetical protein Tco_0329002, partial [Tanacetum coccineum]